MSRVTHQQIADALGGHLPTAEQQRIIEAPLEPALVVAGAGSGKTQTMMTRILWLIANEGVAPHEILGLTFTRKAAGELRERVEAGVAALRRAGLVDLDEFDLPVVSTYNSFANDIYRQYALLIGCEPDAVVLDEPGAFSLMRELVVSADDPNLLEDDRTTAKVTEAALKLAREMRENGVTGDRLERFLDDFEAKFAALPDEKGIATARTTVDTVSLLRPFADLADAYQARKQELGLVEFADQVAYAGEILRHDPSVAHELRALHRVVILDEYQDTSVGQTELLSSLFRGHAVMAVGDPKQSIYGWRGASAANMSRFALDFAATSPPYELSISWRNDIAILAAANNVARSLPEAQAMGGSPESAPTELRPRPAAGAGRVDTAFVLTDDVEAGRIADWMHERLVAAEDGAERTAAVLTRARAQMAPIATALAERGVPYRIHGLGGLLRDPAIVDLNCFLRVASTEHAGNELVRLLVGAHVELGLADLSRLAALRRWIGDHDESYRPLEPGVREAVRSEPQAANEAASLADALDYVRTASESQLRGRGLSEPGIARLQRFAGLLHDLRSLVSLPLIDLVNATIRRTRLDVEAIANPANPVRAENLDAYRDAIRAYTAASPEATIDEFLDWLELAESDDSLATVADVSEQTGIVHLTTMHSAKGLEWDYVAVPQLTGKGASATPEVRGIDGWFSKGVLPYELRHDASDLPSLEWRHLESWTDFKLAFTEGGDPDKGAPLMPYQAQVRQRLLDEHRRLIYVAMTRAREELLLTASLWKKRNTTPQWPADYVHTVTAEPWLETRTPGERYEFDDGTTLRVTEDFDRGGHGKQIAADYGNPGADAAEISWPRPPMSAVAHARATEIVDALDALDADPDDRGSDCDLLIDLLLAERDSRRREERLELPHRFGASYFHEVLESPERIARNAARPMPQEPHTATLLGNLFHSWVESLFTSVSAGATYLDGFEPEDDEAGLGTMTDTDRERLERFKATFLTSRFAPANRRPTAVELPVELPIGGRRIVGKIDAVYIDAETGEVEIVDWKTGVPPKSSAERASRELQLHCYAHAYAAATGTSPERITSTLYYVAADDELTTDRIRPLTELETLLDDAAAAIDG